MIIIMFKDKVHCILTHKDRKKPKIQLQTEEAEYYIKAIAGASRRFVGKKAQQSFIEKICNEAKNEI